MRRTVSFWWVIAAAACILAFFFWYTNSLSATIAELEAAVKDGNDRLTALQSENAELAAMLKAADTDAFVENQARNEYGYMMPDEIRFVITGTDTNANTTESESEIPSP